MKAYPLWIVGVLGFAACTSEVPIGAGRTGSAAGALGSVGEAPKSDGTCDPRLVVCASICVDPLGDPRNCGSCGVACGAEESCNGGQCVPASASGDAGASSDDAGNPGTCGPRLVACGTACVDPLGDPQNCGGCGLACGAQETCSGGRCVPPAVSGDSGIPTTCGPRLTLCGSACVDEMGDPQNCGGCGVACGAQESCDAGACVAPPPPPDAGPGDDAGR